MTEKILQAISDFKNGKMVVVIDDHDRENEGDLVMAAEKITEEAITFMAKKASGLICVAITPELATKLELNLMTENNQESMKTAFTISVDAKHGTTTGISAYERALTILTMINPSAKAEDLVRPGHMFPLIAKDGGVFARRGHTEASIELTKIAGLFPAAVICEIMNDSGKMVRGKELELFAENHNLCLISIDEIVEYLEKSCLVQSSHQL